MYVHMVLEHKYVSFITSVTILAFLQLHLAFFILIQLQVFDLIFGIFLHFLIICLAFSSFNFYFFFIRTSPASH